MKSEQDLIETLNYSRHRCCDVTAATGTTTATAIHLLAASANATTCFDNLFSRFLFCRSVTSCRDTYIEEDIFNKSNLLLEVIPVHKKVPVLVHGNKEIAESFVILDYMDETWKLYPLLPQDPYETALVRFWIKFADEKVMHGGYVAIISIGEEQKKRLKAIE
ncbi:glutathione S-transferase U2-like [Arachis ipaensis]|uniref:glutathione S-transferase U2-like n=1 Tax=Arachis ipaensis TaxID=130454 RepID=UPI000A2B5243|nr:glutathione S-transferase U2-like [Arachis ipaensis]XP_025628111.1 glutathione S-transferase U2-like [Arachis hypogaea]